MKNEPCLICTETRQHYMFSNSGALVYSCAGCGLLTTRGKAGKPELLTNYQSFLIEDRDTELDAFARYLKRIHDTGLQSGKVLVVATDKRFTEFLCSRGFAAETCPFSADTHESLLTRKNVVDCLVLLEVLEQCANPLLLLQSAHSCLRTDGILLNIGITLDAWSAKFLGQSWTGWRPENAHYFSMETLQLLLEKCQFHSIRTENDPRLYTLNHILERAREYPRTLLTRSIRMLFPVLPKRVLTSKIRITSSRLLLTARKAPESKQLDLSIVMPVFNERATFEQALQAVLNKKIEGVDTREIIIVESNSTDGTRQLVESYKSHPEIRIIYEERPEGKGHAVRTGLSVAQGQIITIQDADTEYDVNDYDELVAPLVSYKKAFVLGTRHRGDWKMRHFADQPATSFIFNIGQILFTTLMNVLYGQKMSDPFTMYKIFRRECLYGLHLECSRFDFDHELVIKLILKGYSPHEVPVNYSSRSFSEGKKVTVIADPLLWIKANFKYRFVSPFKYPTYTEKVSDSKLVSAVGSNSHINHTQSR